jgi:hypothetical protein
MSSSVVTSLRTCGSQTPHDWAFGFEKVGIVAGGGTVSVVGGTVVVSGSVVVASIVVLIVVVRTMRCFLFADEGMATTTRRRSVTPMQLATMRLKVLFSPVESMIVEATSYFKKHP